MVRAVGHPSTGSSFGKLTAVPSARSLWERGCLSRSRWLLPRLPVQLSLHGRGWGRHGCPPHQLCPCVPQPSACIQLDSDYLAMCALRKSSSCCFGHGARTTRYRFRAGYRLTEVLSGCPLRPAARRRTTLQPHLPRNSFVPARQPSPHPLHPMSRLLSRMRAADRWPSFTGAWTTSS